MTAIIIAVLSIIISIVSAVVAVVSMWHNKKSAIVNVLNELSSRDIELRSRFIDVEHSKDIDHSVFWELLFNLYDYIGFVMLKEGLNNNKEKEYFYNLFGPNLKRYYQEYYYIIQQKRNDNAGNYIYFEEFVNEYKRSKIAKI